MENDMHYPGYMRRPSPQDMFIVLTVGSREEAVASPVDYFKPKIMLGLNHGAVYVKKFNQETGEATFQTYRLAPDPQPPRYVTEETMEEFSRAVYQQIAAIQAALPSPQATAKPRGKKVAEAQEVSADE